MGFAENMYDANTVVGFAVKAYTAQAAGSSEEFGPDEYTLCFFMGWEGTPEHDVARQKAEEALDFIWAGLQDGHPWLDLTRAVCVAREGALPAYVPPSKAQRNAQDRA
jgi:hypothetical protein